MNDRRIAPVGLGDCEICDQPIDPGQEIYSNDGTEVVHAQCLDDELEDQDRGHEQVRELAAERSQQGVLGPEDEARTW